MFSASPTQGVPPECRPLEAFANSLSIRFSEDGPEFPGELVDAIMDGDVVFLCGSGVSSPQLPDFKRLVELVYEDLDLKKSPSEAVAFDSERYDEVLGSLSRRLVEGKILTRTVSELLAVPDKPDLHNHATILRLSRDRNNRIAVVTTNFDTLLERAVETLPDNASPKDISFAGQSLPAPGMSDFGGIVHIHGRIVDKQLDLEQSQLVLTSSGFGDAYLRSGWASRFFFDLVRCKHIAIVGYRANDVPIRYILNVLEADRTRFSDLKRVYAFTGRNGDPKSAVDSWQTLAVEALRYRITENEGHNPLWSDLQKLAKYIERPRKSFQAHVKKILTQDFKDAGDQARKEIVWLLKEPRYLWSDALSTITDSDWFDFLLETGLWTEEQIANVVAAWVNSDLESADRFGYALQWQRKLGKPFTDRMDRWLQDKIGLSREWSVVWRLYSQAMPDLQDDLLGLRARKPFNGEILLDDDIRTTLSHLVPKLELRRSPIELDSNVDAQDLPPLHSLLGAELKLSDRYGAMELADSLCKLPKYGLRILELASIELRSILELEKDLELISDEQDHNDLFVPAVECHPQNENRDGKIYLVQLMSTILPKARESDRAGTLRVVHTWKNFPGRLGLRLYLHALRDAKLFGANKAIRALISVRELDFWRMNREPALLIKDRAERAKKRLRLKLERRIIESSQTHFDEYDLILGETDWRKLARDKAAWLHLKMLESSGNLSPTGVKELNSIIERNADLNRATEHRDFFGAYISNPRIISGDSTQISQSEGPARLKIVHELFSSRDFEVRRGWRAYCDSDPEGALDTLTKIEFDSKDTPLWKQLLGTLASIDWNREPRYDDLRSRALQFLFEVEVEALQPLVGAICNVLRHNDRNQIARLDEWLLRLWRLLEQHPENHGSSYNDLFDMALNSSAGGLAYMLLREIHALEKTTGRPTEHHEQLVKAITDCQGNTGLLGCAMLVRNIRFIISRDLSIAIQRIGAVLSSDKNKGKRLRTVLLQNAEVNPEVTVKFCRQILHGIQECNWNVGRSSIVAKWIIEPAVAEITNDVSNRWGITAAEAADALKSGCPAIRIGALEALHNHLEGTHYSPEVAFDLITAPFFNQVWPKESKCRDPKQTRGLVHLAILTGDRFPDAIDLMRHYVCPTSPVDSGLYFIFESNVPQKFPSETLDLLWIICGHGIAGHYYRLANLIDRLLEADPNLEADRRLQGLERLADRF